jgi:hypothetical protein
MLRWNSFFDFFSRGISGDCGCSCGGGGADKKKKSKRFFSFTFSFFTHDDENDY